MDTKTRETAVKATLALARAFNRTADEALYTAYELGLEGLTSKQINTAAARALQTSKFMPTPAELRELAGEVTPRARAIIAWESVSKVASSGYYTTVDFDDPVINATVRNIGGWELLTTCEDSAEFESHYRRRFEAAYVALYHHGVSREQAAPLLGYHDRQNALGGYAMQEPLRIETGLPPAQVRIHGPAAMPQIHGEPKRIGEVLAGSLSAPKD